MSAKITSGLFYDDFTGDAGGGSEIMNGNNVDRMKRVTRVDFSWNLQNAYFEFENVDGAGVLTMTNQYDTRTFTGQEFKDGDAITITGMNAGDYTIDKISSDGKSFTITGTFAEESSTDNGSVFGTTRITSLDLFYNLIQNGTAETYVSLVDPYSKQRFTISGIDCEDTTPKAMAIGTKSFAWVTTKITDEAASTTNAVLVKGIEYVDYVQSFEITQYFTITPFALNSQVPNFDRRIPPSYYFAGNSLKYICRIDGKYNSANPIADHSVTDLGLNGTGSWLDQAALGSLGEYYLSEITFVDNDTSESLDRLDIARNVKVSFLVNSRNGKFQTTGSEESATQFIVGFNVRPSDENEYQNTSTTQRDNFFQDSALAFLDAIAVDGQQFGTSRQSITSCICTYVSPTVAQIEFVFDAGSLLASYWKAKNDDDRNYEINVITQDVAITTTKFHDRMTLLVDSQSADYTRKDESLFEFTSTGIEAFKYPDLGLQTRGSIEGFQSEPFFARIAFKVKQHLGTSDTCTVQSIIWQVVCTKTDKADFILEQNTIDFSTAKKLLSVQQIDSVGTRGFTTYEGDPCNTVSVVRDSDNDEPTLSAWIAYYGLILRFETWITALEQYYSSDTSITDIQKYIDEITQDWKSYDNVEGWNLKLRFSISILNLSLNSTNVYKTEIPIVCKEANQVIWAGASGAQTQVNQYFDEFEELELEAIDKENVTLIRTTLTGVFPIEVDEDYCGMISATTETGSVFDRRLAGTEIPSEDGSPFSPTEEDPDAIRSWARGNVRINIFADRINIESYFDPSIYDQAVKNIHIQAVISTTPIIES